MQDKLFKGFIKLYINLQLPLRLLAFLTDSTSSPSVSAQLDRFLPIFLASSIALGLDLLPAIQTTCLISPKKRWYNICSKVFLYLFPTMLARIPFLLFSVFAIPYRGVYLHTVRVSSGITRVLYVS